MVFYFNIIGTLTLITEQAITESTIDDQVTALSQEIHKRPLFAVKSIKKQFVKGTIWFMHYFNYCNQFSLLWLEMGRLLKFLRSVILRTIWRDGWGMPWTKERRNELLWAKWCQKNKKKRLSATLQDILHPKILQPKTKYFSILLRFWIFFLV